MKDNDKFKILHLLLYNIYTKFKRKHFNRYKRLLNIEIFKAFRETNSVAKETKIVTTSVAPSLSLSRNILCETIFLSHRVKTENPDSEK